MKLLYILSEYLPDSGGGIITHYSRMLTQLVRRGHSVKVILASAGKLDQATYEIDGVCVEPLRSQILEKYKGCFERWAGLDIFYYMLPVAWAAWAQAQENFDYDLVEATDWALLFAPWVASPKKAPVVISLHGSCGQVDWYSHTGGERSLGGDLVRMAELASLGGADAIHANSRMNADFWRARTGCEVTVIPPGGGLRPMADGGWRMADGGSQRSEDGCQRTDDTDGEISEGSKHVPCSATAPEARGLVVGRLQNWKGAEVLCQALRLVPNIRVEWVGADTNWDGRGTMASEYLSRTYPDVWGSRLVWLGQMDRGEVAKKIRGAAFLVIPSLWDVFNLTVAEGLEAGVAVVCSRGAGAEMLIEQFKSGFLFESGDAEGLAGCLQQVIGMDAATRAEMVSHAQANVPRIMDSNRILEMVESSYIATVKMGFCPMADEWLKNLFAPGPRQPAPAPAGLVKRVIRKAGRFLSNV
jgi:glycosyltransferase involved in cell wall biosynthesis